MKRDAKFLSPPCHTFRVTIRTILAARRACLSPSSFLYLHVRTYELVYPKYMYVADACSRTKFCRKQNESDKPRTTTRSLLLLLLLILLLLLFASSFLPDIFPRCHLSSAAARLPSLADDGIRATSGSMDAVPDPADDATPAADY